jgi:hypothetical protein
MEVKVEVLAANLEFQFMVTGVLVVWLYHLLHHPGKKLMIKG